jgi:hypothetical protein
MLVDISKVKGNTNNPIIIKDDKFRKLVKSIKEFPEMLELRPIVVDENYIVLGGNMRLKACIEAGLKEVNILIADKLTEDQKQEFIVKDNVGFGEWDWDMIANEWDSELLNEWGLDVWTQNMEINNMSELDIDIEQEFDPIGTSSGIQRVVFLFDGPEEAESWLKQHPSLPLKKQNMAWQIDLTSGKFLENAE